MLVEFGGKGSSCLLSLSALVLSAVWMVLPFPAPCLWGLFVFFVVFYIKAPGPVPTTPPHPTHPRTAVNLSVITNLAARLPVSASAVYLIKCGGSSKKKNKPRTPREFHHFPLCSKPLSFSLGLLL